MATAIADALRKHYRSPREAMDALGLDYGLLEDDEMNRFGKELVAKYGTPRAVMRRLGMDEASIRGTSAAELRKTLLEGIEDMDDDELYEFVNGTLNPLSQDRKLGRDYKSVARDMLQRDYGAGEYTPPELREGEGEDRGRRARTGRDERDDMEPRGETIGDRRRRGAHDSAFVSESAAERSFRAMYPHARIVGQGPL